MCNSSKIKAFCGLCAAVCVAWGQPAHPERVRAQIDAGAGHYVYAPSVFKTQDDDFYAFVCQNEKSGVVVDAVYRYVGRLTPSGDLRWRSPRLVLEPSSKKWERAHTCDPDVRALRVDLGGKTYDWVMTYLGCDRLNCNHNQVGLAVAKKIDGPWVRYDKNPIIAAPDEDYWGAGQSTGIVTGDRTLDVYYTLSAPDEGGLFRRTLTFEKGGVAVGEAQKIRGLKSNAFVARNARYFYAVQPLEVHAPTAVPPVSKSLEILRCAADGDAPNADWEQVGVILPGDTKFPYNHNAGFLTDARGWLADDGAVVVFFSVSKGGAEWLWSYSMYSARFKFSP